MEEKNSKLQVSKSRKIGLNCGSAMFKEAYKDFINSKDNSLSRTIDFPLFKTIIKELYKEISELVLEGKEVALPCGLGNIVVNKRASDKRRVYDYNETRLKGSPVLEYNSHTDGYRFSIQWRKDSPIFGIQNGYQFKAARTISRELARILKNGYGYKYQSLSNKKIDKHEV